MDLVILHYHLNRGGVTSVIENHLRALATLDDDQQPSRIVVACGGRSDAWNADLAAALPFACELVVVPELEYDNFRSNDSSAGKNNDSSADRGADSSAAEGSLFDALSGILQTFDRESTVLHIHNHCLGKNAAIADCVGRLAEQGWKLLLQVHDFAEDLRPANYQHLAEQAPSREVLHSQLYPQAAQIRYAVLNGRDRKVLHAAGIADQCLDLLPNPVQSHTDLFDPSQVQEFRDVLSSALSLPAGQRLVLYPVRPIRRKNLGELLLWSLLVEDTTFAMTLAPLNPQEQTSYQRWVDFAIAQQLPVEFEIASRVELSFEQVYAAADAIVTTSIAEGFGMVYFEACLAQRQLMGRKLPDICHDFEMAGMQFPGLAAELQIPTDAIDLQAARQSHQRWIAKLREDYGLPPLVAEDSSYDLFSGATVDFARLESNAQRDFLRRVKTEATLQETLRELNPHLHTLPPNSEANFDSWQQTHQHNGRVIAEHYSPAVIGDQLMGAYQMVLSSKATEVVRDPSIAQSVLNHFVAPQMLFPIRLES